MTLDLAPGACPMTIKFVIIHTIGLLFLRDGPGAVGVGAVGNHYVEVCECGQGFRAFRHSVADGLAVDGDAATALIVIALADGGIIQNSVSRSGDAGNAAGDIDAGKLAIACAADARSGIGVDDG